MGKDMRPRQIAAIVHHHPAELRRAEPSWDREQLGRGPSANWRVDESIKSTPVAFGRLSSSSLNLCRGLAPHRPQPHAVEDCSLQHTSTSSNCLVATSFVLPSGCGSGRINFCDVSFPA